MYLDELDTVRFDVRNKNYENNFTFAQAAMMKNIIQSQKITLSQTQLFDSGIILKLLKDEPGFVKLFEKGIINVSVFHKDLERLHTDNFKDIVIDKLSQGINGDGRPLFYFSGIDALNDRKLYSDNEKKNITVPREIAIQILQGKAAVDFPPEQKEYFEELINFAEIINSISNSITNGLKYNNLRTKTTKFSLSQLIAMHLQEARKEKEYGEKEYIQTLKQLFDALVEKKQENARGAYYRYLDNSDYCEPKNAEKIKAILDFYYNFVVSESISGLHELTSYDTVLDYEDYKILSKVYKKYTDSDIEPTIKYSITEQDLYIRNRIEKNLLTWDTMNNLPDMIYKTPIKNLSDNCLINIVSSNGKYHSVVCETIPIALTAIVGIIRTKIPSAPPDIPTIYDTYNAIKDMIEIVDISVGKLLDKSKIDDAKTRQLIDKIKKDKLRGGKML